MYSLVTGFFSNISLYGTIIGFYFFVKDTMPVKCFSRIQDIEINTECPNKFRTEENLNFEQD